MNEYDKHIHYYLILEDLNGRRSSVAIWLEKIIYHGSHNLTNHAPNTIDHSGYLRHIDELTSVKTNHPDTLGRGRGAEVSSSEVSTSCTAVHAAISFRCWPCSLGETKRNTSQERGCRKVCIRAVRIFFRYVRPWEGASAQVNIRNNFILMVLKFAHFLKKNMWDICTD